MIMISIKFIIKGSEERERDDIKESNAVLFFLSLWVKFQSIWWCSEVARQFSYFSLGLIQNRLKNDGIRDNAQRSPFLFSRSEWNFKQGAAYKLRGCVNFRGNQHFKFHSDWMGLGKCRRARFNFSLKLKAKF